MGSYMDDKHISTFVANSVGAVDVVADDEVPVLIKRARRQLVEAEIK